jgi:hypothetical protein
MHRAVVEKYMRQQAPSEVAMVVYENNDMTRKLIRQVHNYLKKPSPDDARIVSASIFAEYLPVQRTVDTANFAEKPDSSLLQLADAIAFAISRKIKMHRITRSRDLPDPVSYLLSKVLARTSTA